MKKQKKTNKKEENNNKIVPIILIGAGATLGLLALASKKASGVIPPVQCIDNGDCSYPNEVCYNGNCVSCSVGGLCNPGDQCVGGMCQPIPLCTRNMPIPCSVALVTSPPYICGSTIRTRGSIQNNDSSACGSSSFYIRTVYKDALGAIHETSTPIPTSVTPGSCGSLQNMDVLMPNIPGGYQREIYVQVARDIGFTLDRRELFINSILVSCPGLPTCTPSDPTLIYIETRVVTVSPIDCTNPIETATRVQNNDSGGVCGPRTVYVRTIWSHPGTGSGSTSSNIVSTTVTEGSQSSVLSMIASLPFGVASYTATPTVQLSLNLSMSPLIDARTLISESINCVVIVPTPPTITNASWAQSGQSGGTLYTQQSLLFNVVVDNPDSQTFNGFLRVDVAGNKSDTTPITIPGLTAFSLGGTNNWLGVQQGSVSGKFITPHIFGVTTSGMKSMSIELLDSSGIVIDSYPLGNFNFSNGTPSPLWLTNFRATRVETVFSSCGGGDRIYCIPGTGFNCPETCTAVCGSPDVEVDIEFTNSSGAPQIFTCVAQFQNPVDGVFSIDIYPRLTLPGINSRYGMNLACASTVGQFNALGIAVYGSGDLYWGFLSIRGYPDVLIRVP